MKKKVIFSCPYTELRLLVLHYGFDIKEEAERTCYYTQNPNSMMHTIYNCAFFVAIKKPSRGWNPGRTCVLCVTCSWISIAQRFNTYMYTYVHILMRTHL